MRKILFVCISLILAGFPFTIALHAQETGGGANTVHISSRITDQDGSPVVGAKIYGNEGSVVVRSGEDGTFNIDVATGSKVLVEAEGFASLEFEATSVGVAGELSMVRQAYQLGDRDEVHIPFGTIKRRNLTGSVTVLDPEELLKSDANQDIYDALDGRVPGLYGNSGDHPDIYGMDVPLLVVDGIPRPVTSLNLEEIGQITVLKDPVSRLLYGSKADLPVILFTTKRGAAYKKMMKVRFESGIRNPISYPKYLKSADYMDLYNEALANDGKLPKYDSTSIARTRSGANYVLYPDEQYYNSNYLKKYRSYYELVAEASGGNDIAQYFTYIGWNTENSLLGLGDDEHFNRINMRGNANYKINDYIRMRADGVAIFEFNKNLKNGDFWQNASTFLPNQAPVLIPVTDEDLLSTANLVNDKYVLGGTSIYQDNIYGDMVQAGYTNTLNRILQINTGLDFDLNFITEGLTAKADLTFDMRNYYESRLLNTYAVYEPSVVTGSMGQDSIGLNKIGLDVKSGSESLINPDIYRRIGLFGTLNYKRKFGTDHDISATGVAYRQQLQLNQNLHQRKDLHFGLRASYSFRKKYIAQLAGVVAGSQKLPPENQYGFSPAAGLAWVVSEEDFMQGNLFDFLKLRFDWGLINTDQGIDDYSIYRTTYGQGSWFNYYNGVVRNSARYFSSIANPGLDWIKRKETSAGFEALMMDRTVRLEATWFRSLLYDEVGTRANYYPAYLGTVLPQENFESHLNQGVEAGLTYSTDLGALKLTVGGNFAYSVPKVVTVDEPESLEDYLRKTGKATDAIFGWVDEGLFRDQADIDNHAVQTFGDVQPGDIKYKDLNGDGVVDTSDIKVIGYEQPRTQFALHLNLTYGNFELFVIGTGQTGQSTFFNNPYYWVFGERKYSEPVLDRWTPATAATATYPRLSSVNNSNNFRNSTYWLEKDNWFTLRRVQLTYNLPDRTTGNNLFSGMQVYIRGSNLLTLSPIRDKKELNIGTEPRFRTYAAGINISF